MYMYRLEEFLGSKPQTSKTHMMDGLMMNQNVRTIVVLLLLLVIHVCTTTATTSGSSCNESISIGGRDLLVPVEPMKYRIFLHPYGSGNRGGEGRRLAPFQLCEQCNCCAADGDPSTCADMPCCYRIDCQLPGKPYGVCAFVPQFCNCTSCAT